MWEFDAVSYARGLSFYELKEMEVNKMGCTNELCENPLCNCENLEAGQLCDCSEDNLCPCCIGVPD